MKARRRGQRRRAHIGGGQELDITAFMNLMVVLVPFLLTTAVFSELAMLAIEIPPPPDPNAKVDTPPPPPPKEKPFRLSARLEADGVVIVAGKETLPLVPRTDDGLYDVAALRLVLEKIQADHPEHDTIDLLSRPDSAYGELIQAMDAASTRTDGTPLFPGVRLGEFTPDAKPEAGTTP